jgi:hypothetical protein
LLLLDQGSGSVDLHRVPVANLRAVLKQCFSISFALYATKRFHFENLFEFGSNENVVGVAVELFGLRS